MASRSRAMLERVASPVHAQRERNGGARLERSDWAAGAPRRH